MEKQYKTKKAFEYKWVIVSLCFLMIFVCLGFCSSNKSLFLAPVTEALGIKRSVFSVGDSIRFIATSFVNMFFGSMVNRFGTKKLIVTGIFSLITATLIYSVAESVVWFYIAGAFLGIGFSWTTTTMVGCVIGRWCSESKGTIMGAVLAANGVGAALSTQILSPIIYKEGNPFAYRQAYQLTVVILLVVAVLMLLFYKDKPAQCVSSSPASSKKKGKGIWIGIDLSEAKKSAYFYCALVCVFLTGMVLQGVSGIGAAHMKDSGIDAVYLATVLSIHSLVLACSKFLSGVMYDKLGLRFTALFCDVASVITMLTLAFVSGSSAGRVLAMLYSVFSSLALPLETIMLPIFANDLFGSRSYEHILGIFVSVNTAGYAVGVPLMNFVFDLCGSYVPILFVLCGLMLLVTVVFQFVVSAANRRKAE